MQKKLRKLEYPWRYLPVVDFKYTFGDRIRKLREEKGMTQEQLQAAIGINKTQLSDYENDRRNFTERTIKKFAEFYGVSIDFLVYGEERDKQKITEPDALSN